MAMLWRSVAGAGYAGQRASGHWACRLWANLRRKHSSIEAREQPVKGLLTVLIPYA
jgi:hypothetical protein